MSIDTNALLALPPAEQLQIVELLWDHLGKSSENIPLPEWAEQEAIRRRDQMLADPTLGLSHDQVWKKINNRNE